LLIRSHSSPEINKEKSLPLVEWCRNFDEDEDDTSDEDTACHLPEPPGDQGYFGTSSGFDLLRRLVNIKLYDVHDQPIKVPLSTAGQQPVSLLESSSNLQL
jgi:hypothetical protein